MFINAVKTGFVKAIRILAELLKIVLPVYIAVVLIKHSPVMPYAQSIFAPFMGAFNLPGDAAIPIITGTLTDEYGAIAAIKGISLSKPEITTVAMMVLAFHSIPVESAVMKKLGLSIVFFAVFRFVLAVITGLLIGRLGGIL